MTARDVLLLAGLVTLLPLSAEAAGPPLSPLPHAVGASGPEAALTEAGITAYDRGDVETARDDFRQSLAIRPDAPVATFNLGVMDALLNDRDDGAKAMRRGYALANAAGMARTPQVYAMRAIARELDVELPAPVTAPPPTAAPRRIPAQNQPAPPNP